jgi:hypothetical protein
MQDVKSQAQDIRVSGFGCQVSGVKKRHIEAET